MSQMRADLLLGVVVAEHAREVRYVAGGQYQHVQLGQLGVGGHRGQALLQAVEGGAEAADAIPLPGRVAGHAAGGLGLGIGTWDEGNGWLYFEWYNYYMRYNYFG